MELLIASAFYANVLVADKMTVDELSQSTSTQPSIEEQISSISPIMLQIASCESHVRQFNDDGTVLHGVIDNDDIGIFQINVRYHKRQAEMMGLDIFTAQGNIAYAKYLYEKNGLRDWSASRSCWEK